MDRDALVVVPEAAPQGTSPAPPVRKSAFRALRSRPFRIYFSGQVISASGTFLQQTAIGWLVLELTGSASSLGLVLAAGGIPYLLFGPGAGPSQIGSTCASFSSSPRPRMGFSPPSCGG